MKPPSLLAGLTLVNAAMLAAILAQPRPGQAQDVAPVLRGRALEIVDSRGRLRASITVLPGDPRYRMPDGTVGYPETTLLRLIDPHGRPNVKIGASQEGAGLGLGGEDEPTYVMLVAQGAGTSLKLTNGDGRQRMIAP